MSLFKKNYDEPGMGIPKAPMEKKGFFKFFEIYGVRFWRLIELNLIFILACIPIVTFGPAVAGMTKVARNYSQERNAFIWSDFWKAFKSNFKQAFVMGIIDLIFIAAIFVGFPVYQSLAKENSIMYIPLVLFISISLLFIMMHYYIYLMIVSANLKLTQILKNAFFLVSLGFKSTMFTLLAWIAVFAVLILFYPYTIFIMPFLPFSFLSFVTSFNCYPVIRKFVIQPYYDKLGQDNPEFDYLKLKDDEEVIFEDNVELERKSNANKEKQDKNKGKTIS
ncbi:MAG: YesL family protein [Oscillospiraceae bacterium]